MKPHADPRLVTLNCLVLMIIVWNQPGLSPKLSSVLVFPTLASLYEKWFNRYWFGDE